MSKSARSNSRFSSIRAVAVAAAVTVAAWAGSSRAEDAKPVGVVSHLNLVSDKSEDISSLEAWKRTYIKDGMSDQEKAIAIFNTIVKYRHQANPPREWISSELADGHVHDPLKSFHVYGYGQCCCAAAEVQALARYIGLPVRGRPITAHSVSEVCYDGGWHLIDPSVMNYHVKPDGKLASVDEIHQAVVDWLKDHADFATGEVKERDTKLRKFAKNFGWKNGPELLRGADQFYDKNGINSAGWHGWMSTMIEYSKVEEPDEFYATAGYQLNVQLRPGERITRNFFSRGIEYTNHMSPKYYKDLLDRKLLGIQTKLGDRAPGRVGDGTVEWTVPMSMPALTASALSVENLAPAGSSGVGVADSSQPGVLVLRFPSSYVYVTGKATVNSTIGDGGAITASMSDNNGLDWKEVVKIDKSGEQTIDLNNLVQRRYDYRLKFELSGKGTAINGIHAVDDFQCSQAALPVITEGDNTLTFSAGPQEGTVTVEGSTCVDEAKKNQQLTVADFHPVLNNVTEQLAMAASTGDATFNVTTPGDMTRVRISVGWRARGQGDDWDVLVSTDGGTTFKPVPNGTLQGNNKGESRYVIFSDIPAGTRVAQVRLAGKQTSTSQIFDLRIDADYTEPAGGFRPVKITYTWDEAGQTKTDSHVAGVPNDTYHVTCGSGAVVKTVAMELAE